MKEENTDWRKLFLLTSERSHLAEKDWKPTVLPTAQSILKTSPGWTEVRKVSVYVS